MIPVPPPPPYLGLELGPAPAGSIFSLTGCPGLSSMPLKTSPQGEGGRPGEEEGGEEKEEVGADHRRTALSSSSRQGRPISGGHPPGTRGRRDLLSYLAFSSGFGRTGVGALALSPSFSIPFTSSMNWLMSLNCRYTEAKRT